MKQFIITLSVVMLGIFTERVNAGWFSNDAEKQRRIEIQQQLEQEKTHSGDLGAAVIVLGIGCVVLLVVGTAIGSKGRKDAKRTAH